MESEIDFLKRSIDAQIQKYVASNIKTAILFEACEHALYGGKRIRACIPLSMILAIDQGKTRKNGFPSKHDYLAASSIEYLHAASLIIDDLPCMDNDCLRRDRQTVHFKYGERIAQLASTTLVSLAIASLAEAVEILPQKIGLFIIKYVCERMGSQGASGGELREFDTNGSDINVEEIINMKTSTFFEISLMIGWLFSGGDVEHISEISTAAKYLGLAYQIADDIEDIEQDTLAGSKVNYVINYGIVKTRQDFKNALKMLKTTLPKSAWCHSLEYTCDILRTKVGVLED